jgi:hypothetical protein
LALENSMRVTDPDIASSAFLKSSNSFNYPLFRLELEGQNKKVETVIRFKEYATSSFDSKYDAYFIKSDLPGEAEFASVSNRGDLSINTLPELNAQTVSIPMHQVTNIAGNYTISLTEFTNFNTDDRIIIEDLLTGTSHLLTDSHYSFIGTPGDTDTRFIIHVVPAANAVTLVEELPGAKIYKCQNSLCIELNDSSDDSQIINIYNNIGQKIYSASLAAGQSEYQLKNIDLQTAAIYFVQIENLSEAIKIKW